MMSARPQRNARLELLPRGSGFGPLHGQSTAGSGAVLALSDAEWGGPHASAPATRHQPNAIPRALALVVTICVAASLGAAVALYTSAPTSSVPTAPTAPQTAPQNTRRELIETTEVLERLALLQRMGRSESNLRQLFPHWLSPLAESDWNLPAVVLDLVQATSILSTIALRASPPPPPPAHLLHRRKLNVASPHEVNKDAAI